MDQASPYNPLKQWLPQMTGKNYLRGRTRVKGCKHLTKCVKDDDLSYMTKKPLVYTKTYEQQRDKIMKVSY